MVEDNLSGINNENNIEVYLDEKKLIVEYNSYRNMVYYQIEENLDIGNHKIEIIVTDNSNNTITKKTGLQNFIFR